MLRSENYCQIYCKSGRWAL